MPNIGHGGNAAGLLVLKSSCCATPGWLNVCALTLLHTSGWRYKDIALSLHGQMDLFDINTNSGLSGGCDTDLR